MDFGISFPCDIINYEIDEKNFFEFEEQFARLIEGNNEIAKRIPGGETWGEIPPTREKVFEYYLLTKLLNIQENNVYLDVASCMSLFPNYIAECYNVKVFRQDYLYTEGINSSNFPRILVADHQSDKAEYISIDCIGSNACSLPLPDSSIDFITLHCSFEHFEGNNDSLFVNEALRVLKKNGRLLIIPFYMGNKPAEILHPDYAPGCQFHRYYDPVTFTGRVLSHIDHPFTFSIFHFNNSRIIDPTFYCDLALLIKKEGAYYAINKHVSYIYSILKKRFRWLKL